MKTRKSHPIKRFFEQETAGGILLIVAAALAMLLANSPFYGHYDLLIDTPFIISLGDFALEKPLLLWINDGLMAVFFLLVGLELKRELLDGELSDPRKIALPAVGAIGGMLVPALIYWWINKDNPAALSGWAIPAATDIAFALGVLALLGSRVPVTVKIFLTSIAVFDDIGAILIIAFFYTSKISMLALVVAAVCCAILFICNRSGVTSLRAYLLIGLVMWVALLKSGVHATLGGVILAFFIPMTAARPHPEIKIPSPLKFLEHELHAPVAFLILPIFAFANSGIRFIGMGVEDFTHSVPVGIASGLFFGKQLGVFLFCGLCVLFGWLKLPKGMRWVHLYGVAVLCGIGFTMSLFIGSLAFQESGINSVIDERLGVVFGSLVSAVLGFVVLRSAKSQRLNE
ncbi:Na+/H+ antiporter NhaA [Saccharophagus degradans]|uniref:Na+/H+ antiporter NhaA n=1 Tax=Saccharophagus degradans TaxID=86304 RepID=UPI003390324E